MFFYSKKVHSQFCVLTDIINFVLFTLHKSLIILHCFPFSFCVFQIALFWEKRFCSNCSSFHFSIRFLKFLNCITIFYLIMVVFPFLAYSEADIPTFKAELPWHQRGGSVDTPPLPHPPPRSALSSRQTTGAFSACSTPTPVFLIVILVLNYY